MKKLLVILLLIQTPVFSQIVLWDGGAGTNNWEDAANWNGNALPCTLCTALILGDSVSISSNVTVRSVFVGLNGNSSSSILTVTAGKGKALNISNTAANGIVVHNSKFYNYGTVNISGGGSGGSDAFKMTDGLWFLNDGTINISNFTGDNAMHIEQAGKFFQNGNIRIDNCVDGLRIEQKVTNDGNIEIENESGTGMFLYFNFTNNGTLKFRNNSKDVSSILGTFPVQQQLYNTATGTVDFSQSNEAFDGYDRVFLFNEGIVTFEDIPNLGQLYRIQNDSLINVSNYETGFYVSIFENNKVINFTNADNTEGTAIIGKEFTNNGNVNVSHATQAFKTATPYTGNLSGPNNQFNNYGNITIKDVQTGVELDTITLENFAAGVIKVDTFQFKALKITGDVLFSNHGMLEFNHQFQEDTCMVINLTQTGGYGTSAGSTIKITNAYRGIALNTVASSVNDYFFNEGNITIDSIFVAASGDLDSFAFSKYGTGTFTNNGLMEISNTKGYGFLIDKSSLNGVNIGGTFKGKNNTISIFNNSGVRGNNLNKFRVLPDGLVYSRGDSLYSILDSTLNSLGNAGCGIIDVVNINKVNDILTVNGLVKLTGKGSSFHVLGVEGLLIDPYADIYPGLSNLQRSNIHYSAGIGGGTSAGIKEMDYFSYLGNFFTTDFSGYYLDSALTVSAGSYSFADNSFTPSFSTENATEMYFEYAGRNCSYFSSMPVLGNTCPYEVTENEFTGAVDNDWHKPGNWSLNAVPNICHRVTIPASKRSVIETGRKARSAGISTFNGAVYDVETGSVLDIIPAQ